MPKIQNTDASAPEGAAKIADIKAIAEGARALAEERIRGQVDAESLASRQNRDAGLVLVPELADLYVEADNLLNGVQDDEMEKRDRAVDVEASEHIYYVKCRENHPPINNRLQPQHGVYLTRNPGEGELGPDDWFATYRARGKAHRGDIVCQVCFNALPIIWNDARKGTFRVETRWLWMRNKKSGVETRAMLSRFSANNEWKDRMSANAQKATV